MSWRDTTCGELRAEDVGRRVTLAGWVDTRRDHGGLVFVDLRDHTGMIQLVDQPGARRRGGRGRARDPQRVRAPGRRARSSPRAPDAVNPNLPTGEIEVQVDTLRIVSRSTPLPFQLDEESVDENLRLRYRWLDLRTERMQRNLRLSHRVIAAIRRTMDELGFVDIWTPSMTKGTPEGARDFLVPVRLQPGRFFALAQSPQLFKQLTQIGGLDRYYQIAICWRDEDLRADRQFEFRQLDVEMAFVEREDVLDVLEAGRRRRLRGAGARRAAAAVPAHLVARGRPALRLRQAGPPLRARDPGRDGADARLRVRRLRERGGGAVPRRAAGVLARRARAARGDGEGVGGEGARVYRPRRVGRGALADREVPLRAGARGVRAPSRARPPLRRRRAGDGLARARRRSASISAASSGSPTRSRNEFLWVIDFPMFEWDEDTGRWTFVHHPFTGVKPGQEHLRGRSRRVHQRGVRPHLERQRSSAAARSGSTSRRSSAPSSARWG